MTGAPIVAQTRARAGRVDLPAVFPAVAAGSAVVGLGLANGAYFPSAWGWAALAFALVALLAALGRDRLVVGRLEWLTLAALGSFAAWTLLSTVWSPSSAQPVLAFERTAVYVLALLAVFAVATSPASATLLAGGVLGGIVVLCADGLAARVDGSSVSPRLAAPIGYENAVGILAAVGILVALGLAATASARSRVLCLGTVPLLAAALYLTSSRGSWLALGVGGCVALGVETRRRRLLGTVAAALPAAALVTWSAARAPTGAWLGVALVASTAVALALGVARPKLSLDRRLFAAAALLVVVAGAVAWPTAAGGRLPDASGNGRGAYWRVALREVEARPLLGGGAGSYVRYWDHLRPSGFPGQNAHNLYLETLAELGPFGLVLLLSVFALPFVAVRRARAHPVVPAAAAGFAAFVVHAAVDWDFQLPVVAVAGLVLAGALLVAARRPDATRRPSRARWLLAAAVSSAAVLAIAAQAGNSALAGSRAALDRDDTQAATRLARRAHRWQPWSFEPWQLLGEAQLAAGRPEEARASFRRGLSLDRTNAALWADLAEAASGSERTAALARARALDPFGG